jgi:hypothetical protein
MNRKLVSQALGLIVFIALVLLMLGFIKSIVKTSNKRPERWLPAGTSKAVGMTALRSPSRKQTIRKVSS